MSADKLKVRTMVRWIQAGGAASETQRMFDRAKDEARTAAAAAAMGVTRAR